MINSSPITPPQDKFDRWEDDILNERENVDFVLDCVWKDGFKTGADKEMLTELYLDFSRPGRIGDLKFSKETPAPHVPPAYISTAATDYLTERAQEFLDKFQEVYLASDDDKYVIATVLRMIAHSPDLVDLTESDLLDLANAILQL
jgi:hypothetical protein